MIYMRLAFLVLGGGAAFYAGARGLPVIWSGVLAGVYGVNLINMIVSFFQNRRKELEC